MATKLPPVADEALTSAEDLLDHKTGDARTFACLGALSFLAIAYQNAPGYAYAARLYADCLFRTGDLKNAEIVYEKYLALVPVSARHGKVGAMVDEAKSRLRTCRLRLGHPSAGELPGPPVGARARRGGKPELEPAPSLDIGLSSARGGPGAPAMPHVANPLATAKTVKPATTSELPFVLPPLHGPAPVRRAFRRQPATARRSSTPLWVGGGAAVALAAVGAWLGASTLNDATARDRALSSEAYTRAVTSAGRDELGANIAFGASAVAAITGAAVYWLVDFHRR